MTHFPKKALFASLAVAAMLAGCANNPPPPLKMPDMHFYQRKPISLDVARIDYRIEYKAPAEYPHIEYDMPVSPEKAIRTWVEDRFNLVGKSGVMRVVIREASATETALKTDQSFTGMFKKEQAANVEMKVDVTLEMLDDRQFVLADVKGKASRSSTEPEGQKLNERDRLLYDMTFDLVKGLDDEISGDLPNAFGRWTGQR
jgi:hypothetical protein